MRPSRTALCLPTAALLVGASLAGVTPGAAQSEVTTYSPSHIVWKELSYSGSKLGVSAESEVRIELVPAAEARPKLITAPDRAVVELHGERVARIVIESSIRGTESVSELLLRPDDAVAYQRAQVARSKKRSYRRVYRYLTDGVFVQRQIPRGEPDGDPLSWPVHNSRVIEFPPPAAGKGVTEGMALFYILSAADLRHVGDRLGFINFDRDGMSEVMMTVENLQQMEVDYREVSPSGERRVEELRTVALLSVGGNSIGRGAGDFEFLGLRGRIEIFVDTELRIPVAVRGKVPVVGRTMVKVDRVVLD